MGGEPLYYFSQPKGILMRISDQVKKCVGFVGIREGLEIKWGGTAFFINISEDDLKFYYMVTAKHVAEALDGSDCVIRVNNRQGPATVVEASAIKWWYHPTESATVDSAVIHSQTRRASLTLPPFLTPCSPRRTFSAILKSELEMRRM